MELIILVFLGFFAYLLASSHSHSEERPRPERWEPVMPEKPEEPPTPKEIPKETIEGLVILGLAFIILLLLAYACGGTAPVANPPTGPVPEDHFVIRPIWHSMDRVPKDLQGRLPPAILVDPNDYYERKILDVLGAEGPGQYDLKSIPNWGDQLMAWGKRADPYVWFQPNRARELCPGPWNEIVWEPDGSELFRRWFEEADLILVEET